MGSMGDASPELRLPLPSAAAESASMPKGKLLEKSRRKCAGTCGEESVPMKNKNACIQWPQESKDEIMAQRRVHTHTHTHTVTCHYVCGPLTPDCGKRDLQSSVTATHQNDDERYRVLRTIELDRLLERKRVVTMERRHSTGRQSRRCALLTRPTYWRFRSC